MGRAVTAKETPPAAVRRLLQGPDSPAEARRSLDVALDALLEVTGAREGLVAILRPHESADVRLTPGLDPPSDRALREAAGELAGTTGKASMPPGLDLLATAERSAGGFTLAAVLATGVTQRAAFETWGPLVLLGLSRSALLLREHRRTAELLRLNATAQRVAASLDLDDVLSEIVRDAAELLGADSGDMLLSDTEREVLRVVAVANFPQEILGFEMSPDEGVSSRAMSARRTMIVDDYQRYRHRVRRLDGYGFRAVLCAPLIARGEAIGALNVHVTDAGRSFSQDDARLLTAFAHHAAIAIDNARRYRNEVRLSEDLLRANEELERSLTLQQRLVAQVLLNHGPQGVASELATLLARPVVLQDHLFRVMAGASPPGQEPWEPLVLPRDPAVRGSLSRLLERVGAGGEAAQVPADVVGGPARIVAPIRIGRDLSGYLVLPFEELTSLETALIQVASTGVALELAKLRTQVEVEHRLRGDVGMDLLTGAYTSPAAIAGRAAQLGYDLAEPRDLIVLRIDDHEGETRNLGEPLLLDLKRRSLDLVDAEVTGRAPDSMVVGQGETIIVLLAARSGGSTGKAVTSAYDVARELKRLLQAELPDLTVSAVVGDTCSRPEDYAPAFRVAEGTLDAVRRLGRRDQLLRPEDLGAYRLLISAADPNELREFAQRALGPLLADDEGRRELLATLRAYVEAGFNQREVARRSFVHFNTVANRLRRIETLLGIDLTDAQALLDLTFALRVGSLLELF